MKKLALAVLVSAYFLSGAALAEEQNSISFGYAQSNVKVDGINLDGSPRGFNLKYRYEIDKDWGVITSYTHTQKSYSARGNGVSANAKLSYNSFEVGPTLRLNDYVSLYALAGFATGKAEVNMTGYGDSAATSTSFAGGFGMQFNPMKNAVIDAHYEYSKLDDVKVGTWVLGAGFRF